MAREDEPSIVVVAFRTALAHLSVEIVSQTTIIVGADAVVKKIVVIPGIDTSAVLAKSRENPALAHDVTGRKVPGNTYLAEELGGCDRRFSFGDGSGKDSQEADKNECNVPHLVVNIEFCFTDDLCQVSASEYCAEF